VSWLIFQRLEDITKRTAMRSELKHDIGGVRNWSLGLMLLAIVGLLAKLLVPGV
jgi:hypothetical protein